MKLQFNLATKSLSLNQHDQPLVSFLTVNYNQAAVTLELIESLQKLHYTQWECVVVDNGSQSSSLAETLAPEPRVKYLYSAENLGFAGGNNLGLPHCQGAYIFFINNDTELPADCLEPLVSFAEARGPKLGMLCPMLKFFDPPQHIQYAGAAPMNYTTMRGVSIGFDEEDRGQYRTCHPTPFAHGAAMLVPRRVLEKVGPMYTGYFLYYEELDWSERIRAAGYDIWYCGECFIWHKESLSTGKNSPLKTYYLNRNRLLFARRNLGGLQLITNLIYMLFVSFPKNYLGHLFKGETEHRKALRKAYAWHWGAARKIHLAEDQIRLEDFKMPPL